MTPDLFGMPAPPPSSDGPEIDETAFYCPECDERPALDPVECPHHEQCYECWNCSQVFDGYDALSGRQLIDERRRDQEKAERAKLEEWERLAAGGPR
jgi:hypothetical protein